MNEGGAKRLLGLSDTAVAVTKSVLTLVAATVTIFFLTFFMLLEGGAWVERFYAPPARALAAALETRRRRDLPHDRRLRDGQPR